MPKRKHTSLKFEGDVYPPTTTQLLKRLVSEVQGDILQVHPILIGNQNIHIEEPKNRLNNSVRGRWESAKEPVDHPYSSYRFYENGSDWNNLRIQSLF